MLPIEAHLHEADVSFDGGDLDCGSGLLLLIRQHIDPLEKGGLLKILSTESSVEAELPAWCRLTGNELVSYTKQGRQRSYLIAKGKLADRSSALPNISPALEVVPVSHPASLPEPAEAPAIEPLSVMGVGSWPRPSWVVRAIHEHLEGRLSDEEFATVCADATRLAVADQEQAGADVISDGEQGRDNYASFVGGLLDNCRLVPLSDLLAMVEHPDEFKAELDSLDVPAESVRHPVVFGPLGRSRPLVANEAEQVLSLTDRPVKAALPGPYLLTRLMWLDCITDRVYASREELSNDIVRVLKEECHHLLSLGVSLVQFDEPVLSEVVFTGPKNKRSFMCGALSESGDAGEELAFAGSLINRVVEGLPLSRTAVHVCRGNWTTDESVALTGSYEPLLAVLSSLTVGTLFLELCTPRAGEIEVLAGLPASIRVGAGMVNPKSPETETVDDILRRIERAASVLGAERLLLTPDCGFATFCDSPVCSRDGARAKLANLKAAASRFKMS
ncbi:MAG: 5-methyltetrahydropteroyltriglutamate--homocysteine methyltransferase [Cyanobacteria bacterium HKST-UBA02]|nr:5-methyltetrahydropteroyltriglutamate--homocysteine methyltransferase [Cyanobacteria bacterium HKST-UBA02]